ncbi:hypothetical protein [Nocardioides sp. W7]|uniref:hypothetical protein n=1 Tax=Nocardioides sp. W7 TaxID=2931390 RepID=UPI001FCFD10F|nr:hypothetical protein [Nocardioides sp. W7]
MKITLNRKLLLSVASVLGAGVLAVATGVLSSGASAAPDGVRLVGDESGGAVLVVTALEPGDSVTRTVTIENTTDAESRMTFTEQGGPATFADGELQVVIDRDGDELYDGRFGEMGDFAQDVGLLPAGGSATFSFTVSLPDDAEFVPAGTQRAEASYTWLTGRS